MNIGTTVTAWLAAFNGSAEARQTALAHTLFNVIGTIVIIPFFVPAILPVATSFFPHYADAVTANGITTYPNVAAPMAAIHTLFNLITTALFLPFVKPFARLVARIIRTDAAIKPHLSALKMTSHLSPVIACDQALLEVTFMRDSDLKLLSGVRKVLTGEADQKLEEHIAHREDILDNVQREVTEFLGKIMVKRVPTSVAERARRLLRMSDELESVSDDPNSPIRVLVELDIINAYERVRAYYLNIAETLAGGKGN